jgi:hypothetical protein
LLIAKLQESELASRGNRVIRQDEDDFEDDEDIEADTEADEDETEQESRQESLAKLSQYEKAVAQLNELSDKLTAAKTAATAANKTKKPGKVAATREATTEGPVTEISFAEKPRRVRAPKTRFTNPLTGSVPVLGMSKAKRAVKESEKSVVAGTDSGKPARSVNQQPSAPNVKAELQDLEERLKVLKEAVATSDEAVATSTEAGEDPDYPDLPNFRLGSNFNV